MKHYQNSDNGLKKIKKISSTKPRQKNIQIPEYEDNEDGFDDDDYKEIILITTDN